MGAPHTCPTCDRPHGCEYRTQLCERDEVIDEAMRLLGRLSSMESMTTPFALLGDTSSAADELRARLDFAAKGVGRLRARVATLRNGDTL